MHQTQFPLSNNNYTPKIFAELHHVKKEKLEYYRKKKDDIDYWVCCVENGLVKGYKINEERYLIWLEGGQKLKALIKYLKGQESLYSP